MRFYARCGTHECTLMVKDTTFFRNEITRAVGHGLFWQFIPQPTYPGGYYELDLNSFQCPVAGDLGQEGFYVTPSGVATAICRGTWYLQPTIEEATNKEEKQMTRDEALTKAFEVMFNATSHHRINITNIHPLDVLKIVKEYADALQQAYDSGRAAKAVTQIKD